MTLRRTLAAAALIVAAWIPSHADVPMLLNYQGYLTGASGNPENGMFTIDFAVFDAEAGGNQLPTGTPWGETQSVQVTNGVFNVLLGSVTALPEDLFTGGPSDSAGPVRYLQVTISGESLGPRRRITSVAYAISAGTDISVRVDNSTNISQPDGLQALSFDTEQWDTGCPPPGMRDPANPSRLTACVAGKYYIFGQVHWEANVNGLRQLLINVSPVSGGTFSISNAFRVPPQPADEVALETSTHQLLNAGDYVELVVLQASGGPLDVVSARSLGEPHYSYTPVFGMVKLP